METKFKYITLISSLLTVMFLFSACENTIVSPDMVPIKAEIKQVIVKNSIYRTELINRVTTDIDTLLITVPQGTDVSNLDLDILVSYFGTITPQAGVTDLTNPVTYTVTTNVETRDVVVMAAVVPPSLTNFMITSPVQSIAKIEDNNLILRILEGTDLSTVSFSAAFFGESLEPSPDRTIDLSVENPILKVTNKNFVNTYNIVIDYYSAIEFTGKIYDGTVHPNDFLAGSVKAGDAEGWIVENETLAYKERVVHFTSLGDNGTDGHNGQAGFSYADMGLNADPDETTTIFRVKGIADAEEDYLEIAFKLNGLRAKFFIAKDNLEIKGSSSVKWAYSSSDGSTIDPTQWNIYRVTCNKVTRDIKVYINEDAEPKIEATLESHNGAAVVSIGDGGSGKYECLIDYVAFEADGAYAPKDLPISEIFD